MPVSPRSRRELFRLKALAALPCVVVAALWLWAFLSFLFLELGAGVRALGLRGGVQTHDAPCLLLVYCGCAAMALLCLWRARCIGPGSVARSQSSDLLKALLDKYLAERAEAAQLVGARAGRVSAVQPAPFSSDEFKCYLAHKGYRFCAPCWVLKPHRAHHCRQCGSCRLKLDHHCNWVEVCVGLRNYKAFLLFVLYAWAAAVVAALRLLAAAQPLHGLALYLRSCAQLFTASLAFLLSALCLLHMGVLAARNRSTIEFCEGKADEAVYSRGLLANWAEVFGANPLLWPLPTAVAEAEPEELLFADSTEEESLGLTAAEGTAGTAAKQSLR